MFVLHLVRYCMLTITNTHLAAMLLLLYYLVIICFMSVYRI